MSENFSKLYALRIHILEEVLSPEYKKPILEMLKVVKCYQKVLHF